MELKEKAKTLISTTAIIIYLCGAIMTLSLFILINVVPTKSDVNVLTTRLSALEKTVEETKGKISTAEADIEELNQQLGQLATKAEIEDIKNTCEEFQEYVDILEEISSEREKVVWFIQVASFRDPVRCDKLEESLKQVLKDKEDLTFFRVKSIDDQGDEWFGVRIGYFDTQMSASRCQERLVSRLQYLRPVVFPGSKQIW